MKIELTVEELEKIIGAGGYKRKTRELSVPPINEKNKPTTTDKFDPTPDIKSRDW